MRRRTIVAGGLLTAVAGLTSTPAAAAGSTIQDIEVSSAIDRIWLSASMAMGFRDYAGARVAGEKLYEVRQYSERWNTHSSAFLIGVILIQVTPKTEKLAYAKACQTVLACYEVAMIFGNLDSNIRAIAIAANGLLTFDTAGYPTLAVEESENVATLALAFAGLAFGPERQTWAKVGLAAARKYGTGRVHFWEEYDATARMLAAGTAASGDWKAAAAAYEHVLNSSSGTLSRNRYLSSSTPVSGLWAVMAGATTVEGEAGSVIALGGNELRGLAFLEASRRGTLSRARASQADQALSATELEARLTRQGVVVVQPICSWAGCYATVSRWRGNKVERQAAFNAADNSCELFFRMVNSDQGFLMPRDGLLPTYISARKRKGDKRTAAVKKHVERAAAIAQIVAGSTIRSALRAMKVGPDEDVLIILPASLALLPIGLSQASPTGPRLMHEYRLRYAESLLGATRNLGSPPSPDREPAVPTSNPPAPPLRHLQFEIAAVTAEADPGVKRAVGTADPAATFGALQGHNYWHVASHARWDFKAPEQSGLALTAKRAATVTDVLSLSPSSPPRLVYLSACETGMIDIRKNLNDFVGLPSAFLAAGAVGVIGTLWAVSDAASALLSAYFYDVHWGEARLPSDALRRAQKWLATSTANELQTYVATKVMAGKITAHDSAAISGFLADTPGDQRPFEHPYYWGGFELYGQ